MVLRTGHGKGAGSPRIEVMPADELPQGLPQAPAGPPVPELPGERDERGRFLPGARTQQSRGARAANAKAEQLALLTGLGLLGTEPAALKPFLDAAGEFSRAEVVRLAQVVGGGHCGNAPASMVDSAALQLAASRAAYAQGDLALGSRLANDSRQNLLAAHELAAREAKARPRAPDSYPWLTPAAPAPKPAKPALAPVAEPTAASPEPEEPTP